MLCKVLRLVLRLGLVRVSSRVRIRIRVKVKVSVMVRVSIRTSWVVNFALFCCYRPVIYTRPTSQFLPFSGSKIRRSTRPLIRILPVAVKISGTHWK